MSLTGSCPVNGLLYGKDRGLGREREGIRVSKKESTLIEPFRVHLKLLYGKIEAKEKGCGGDVGARLP